MAIEDAYITDEEYDARAQRTSSDGAATLEEELIAASRVLDYRLGLAPGAINPDTGERRFSGNERQVLTLLDGAGQHLLRSNPETAATVTVGAIELEVGFDAGVVGLPGNAATFGLPFDSLELIEGAGSASWAYWPRGRWNIVVDGDWGYAEIPEGIKDAVTSITRDLRDHHAAGAGGRMQMNDTEMPLSDQTWRRISELQRQFSYRPGARVLS